MNISQGLRRVKAITGELATLDQRLRTSIQWVKDKPPAYKYEELDKDRNNLANELVSLRTALARANIEAGITRRLHELNELKGKIALVSSYNCRVAAEETEVEENYEYSYEHKANVNVEKKTTYECDLIETQRDGILRELRRKFAKINDEVESLNHVTELK